MSKRAKTLFESTLSDEVQINAPLTRSQAENLFNYFKNCSIFRWKDANNDCEDRANAICMLLEEWKIPSLKGWVFSGEFLKKENGTLTNCWKYHVGALLPVKEDNSIQYYIVDPATSNKLETVEDWAHMVTDNEYSYHIIKSGNYYIFKDDKIQKDNWHQRDKQNYKWTIQGLAGINGLSATAKAKLRFNKTMLKKTEAMFKELMKNKPVF